MNLRRLIPRAGLRSSEQRWHVRAFVRRVTARWVSREAAAAAGTLGRLGLAVALAVEVLCAGVAHATEEPRVVLDRAGSQIALEPYAPNIIRVSLSLLKDQATSPPGYGFIATPSVEGWTQERSDEGDIYRSSRLVVRVAKERPGKPLPTQVDIAKFFSGSTPGAHITIGTPQGRTLLELTGWSMSVPNHKDGNAGILNDRRPTDAPFYQVGATFTSPDDEHYYGLGQNQQGFLDLRGRVVECWHNYDAAGGPSVGVPFVITNRGYGLIWDNPSKTTFEPGFNEQTRWTSEVGDRVSFFVIGGATSDEIYSGYRHLTGVTPLLPKAAYGYIQCKQRYATQDEVLAVARGYRERHLPADVLVVDWFYYTKMGQMDMDPAKWPDPAAMNRQLHEMGFETMISVWPRFVPGSRYYDFLLQKGWFEHLADGTPTDGLPYDRAGSDIDTTNPEAARWFWNVIRDNLLSKGFDALWADETEPDLPPNGSYFQIGPGTRYFNVYPLLHTAALYEGFRRDLAHRALILSRDAYLGAQRNGTMFWSSDIYPTWDTLKRQVPTGLNFTASGMAYWSNDIGGWQYLPEEHHPAHPPLLDPSDARDNVGGYDDYPELYTRWFEYAAFTPVFRAHGSRKYNEVWSYGRQAEPILTKYLKLRYELLHYIYSLGYNTYLTGAPFMRALFMDFPHDPKVADLRDEYMFGPAFLVAPVTDQGATHRTVYLPAGVDWYNYWTNERVRGGQTIEVDAPIDTLPLFVRAGSILPLGEPIESTQQVQEVAKVRVYAGANGDFTLYRDDGKTHAYEKGESRVTQLHWDDAAQHFSHEGAVVWIVPDERILEVVGR
ncbi:MAG: glycoside hydrolase family 31 protein [Acidobacteriia bacterium]|nr:glycoside hydrolase family 31 protein [Terriglobia bacterium]